MKKVKYDENQKSNPLLSEYGKQKLLMCANSFAEIANSFKEDFVCEEAIDREEYLYQKKAWENKKLFFNNMHDMSDIMRNIAEEVFHYEPLAGRKYRQIVGLMKLEKIDIKDICYITESEGRISVGMYMRSMKSGGVHIDDAAGYLSYILDKQLVASPCNEFRITSNWNKFTFLERSKFVVMTGVAKAIKEGEEISGDNYSIFENESGKFNVLLSDGMGSGEQASTESEEVIELIEKLLEIRYPMEDTLKLANHMLALKHQQPNMSTLDCCQIDLNNGECELFKIGSATTFIKKIDKVEFVTGNSLPFNTELDIHIDYTKITLVEGEFIILLTDGALESSIQNEEKEIEEVIAEGIQKITTYNAKEIAESLMQQILHLNQGIIRDDITIIAIGIWEKT